MAQTSFDAMAATPFRSLYSDPGLGLWTRLHCVPFQCSVSVPRPLPTAHISLAAIAATALNVPLPRGSAEGTKPVSALAFKPECAGVTRPFVEVALLVAPVGSDQALRKSATMVTSMATLRKCFIVHSPVSNCT